eukprot:g77892.t1
MEEQSSAVESTPVPPAKFDSDAEEFNKLPFPDQLWSKLNHLFGNDDTLLTMEWPGRVLDDKSFLYEIEDSYSGFLKPVAVRDAEFSIADELFPVQQITGGPLGSSLAMMYKLVLDELTERVDYPSGSFKARKLQVLQKLHELLPGPDGNKWTLRQVHEYWMDRYVALKARLQAELNAEKAKGRRLDDSNEKHALFDKLPILNDKIQTQLNSAWKDLITEGRHHEVMSMLSILDAQSPGELLQETKDRMRNTGISSLDGTEVTYPVWFQPRDWARHLSTRFTPRDLLMEPDSMLYDLAGLQAQKEAMLRELSSLEAMYSGDPDVLKKQVDDYRDKLTAARTKLGSYLGDFLSDTLQMFCKRLSDCFLFIAAHSGAIGKLVGGGVAGDVASGAALGFNWYAMNEDMVNPMATKLFEDMQKPNFTAADYVMNGMKMNDEVIAKLEDPELNGGHPPVELE